MKLCKMIEIYLKYDNMHTIGVINAFICINNHVNSYVNNMLSGIHGYMAQLLPSMVKVTLEPFLMVTCA